MRHSECFHTVRGKISFTNWIWPEYVLAMFHVSTSGLCCRRPTQKKATLKSHSGIYPSICGGNVVTGRDEWARFSKRKCNWCTWVTKHCFPLPHRPYNCWGLLGANGFVPEWCSLKFVGSRLRWQLGQLRGILCVNPQLGHLHPCRLPPWSGRLHRSHETAE